MGEIPDRLRPTDLTKPSIALFRSTPRVSKEGLYRVGMDRSCVTRTLSASTIGASHGPAVQYLLKAISAISNARELTARSLFSLFLFSFPFLPRVVLIVRGT